MRTLYFLLVLIISHTVSAQTFKKGGIIDTVACSSNPSQSYALYLPSNYTKEQSWPIIYIFEPAARGKLPLRIFQKSAEEFGYILVCSNNSKNGSWANVFEAAKAMKKDTELKFNIDSERIYTSGFSGGSRAAMVMAKSVYKARGIIACAGAYPSKNQYMITANDSIAYAAIVGNLDMNYLEHIQLAEELTSKEIDNVLFITNKTHQWANSKEIFLAMQWLELRTNDRLNPAKRDEIIDRFKFFGDRLISQNLTYTLPMLKHLEGEFGLNFSRSTTELLNSKSVQKELKESKKIEIKELKHQKVLIQAFATIPQTKLDPTLDSIHTVRWWKFEIDKLRRKGESKNQYQSNSAKRLSNYIWASFAEISITYEIKGEYLFAIDLNKLWQYAQPKSVWAVYSSAKLYALTGDDEEVIKSLYKAKELGMSKKSRLNNQPAFQHLNGSKEFQDILAQLEE